ncbi:hypothetical protein SXCC_02157 [Gluconacetobacter sp. SXCC-1]|nr:hypothetical protein SXCC_02157 [Gluconacetobacter sp. SXCC-1]
MLSLPTPAMSFMLILSISQVAGTGWLIAKRNAITVNPVFHAGTLCLT